MTTEEGVKICLACGREFRPKRPDQRLCPDNECGVSEKERQRVIRRFTGRCLECGWLLADGHSENCRQAILDLLGLPKGPCPWCGKPSGEHGKHCELYIYAEQDGLCPICGRELVPDLAESDPDYVNRDHVFPRSKLTQGEELRRNKVLVHYRCNIWKADDPAPFGQPEWGVLAGISKRPGRLPGTSLSK